MELIVAVLMALGFLSSPDLYNDEYRSTKEAEIGRANYVIENEYYRWDDGGGTVVITDIP